MMGLIVHLNDCAIADYRDADVMGLVVDREIPRHGD